MPFTRAKVGCRRRTGDGQAHEADAQNIDDASAAEESSFFVVLRHALVWTFWVAVTWPDSETTFSPRAVLIQCG